MVNMASLSRIVAIPHGSPGRRLSLDRRHSAGRKTRRQLTWPRRTSLTAKNEACSAATCSIAHGSPGRRLSLDRRRGADRKTRRDRSTGHGGDLNTAKTRGLCSTATLARPTHGSPGRRLSLDRRRGRRQEDQATDHLGTAEITHRED